MKNTNGSEDWHVLCELASKEQDPNKMIDLITKINKALEELHQKSRSPLNGDAYFHHREGGTLCRRIRSGFEISMTSQCWSA